MFEGADWNPCEIHMTYEIPYEIHMKSIWNPWNHRILDLYDPIWFPFFEGGSTWVPWISLKQKRASPALATNHWRASKINMWCSKLEYHFGTANLVMFGFHASICSSKIGVNIYETWPCHQKSKISEWIWCWEESPTKNTSCCVEVVCRRITNDSRKWDAKKKTHDEFQEQTFLPWHRDVPFQITCENWMDFTKYGNYGKRMYAVYGHSSIIYHLYFRYNILPFPVSCIVMNLHLTYHLSPVTRKKIRWRMTPWHDAMSLPRHQDWTAPHNVVMISYVISNLELKIIIHLDV